MQTYLLLFFLLVVSLTDNHHHVSAQSPPALSMPESNWKMPDNETIYKVSKELCWGCIGQSLQFLFAHNLVRAAKWELPLMWDFQLEKYANWWAGQRKADCKLQHSFPEGGFKLGENIYWGSGTSWTPTNAVNAWASEEKYYTYATNTSWTPTNAVNAWASEEKYYTYATNTCQAGEMCGHYTQIVWRNTRRIGCARAVCDDGDVFMTCNYDPPGNYIGERPY